MSAQHEAPGAGLPRASENDELTTAQGAMSGTMNAISSSNRSSEIATDRADRIRSGMVAVAAWLDDVTAAWNARDWAALGYASWEAYTTAEFGEHRVSIPAQRRGQIVSALRDTGMSTRAIASATGLSKGTIGRELGAGAPSGAPGAVTGTDGKTYAATRTAVLTRPEAEEVTEQINSGYAELIAMFRASDPGTELHIGELRLGQYRVHPAATLFPWLNPRRYAQMVASVRDRGLRLPITLTHDGTTIVDGRIRYMACMDACRDPLFERLPSAFSETDILNRITSENLLRQHHTPEETADAETKLAAMYAALPGGDQR